MAAAHRQRREAAAARAQLRAHQAQRLGDPVDRAPADRLVAVERERAALLRRQPAGQQAQQRARVAHVDRPIRFARLAQAGAAHDHLLAAQLHQRAERAHRLQRRVGVGRVQVALDPHRLGGHRAEQRRAMGDRLVRRRAQLAVSPRAGSKRLFMAPPSCPRHGKAELADQPLGALEMLVAADPQRDDPLAIVLRGRERHVDDVDTRAAER